MASSNSAPVPLQASDMPIWIAYGDMVKNALTAGSPLGDNDRVYICAPTSQPVPGGPWTLPEITNHYVREVGDSLLEDNSPLYNPVSKLSYIQWLTRYLAFADPDPAITKTLNPRKAAYLQQLAGSVQAAALALPPATSAATTAWTAYNDQQYNEGNDKISFDLWLTTLPQDPDVVTYNKAQNDYTSASTTYAQEYVSIYGDAGTQVLGMVQNIQQAGSMVTQYAGLNMPALDADVGGDFQKWLGNNKMVPSDKGDAIYYTPDYSMQGLVDDATNWAKNFNGTKVLNNTPWTLNIQKDSDASFLELGHSQARVSSGNDVWIFFSQTSESDNTTSTQTVKFDDASTELDLTINFAGLEALTVNPGSWDVPGVQKLFPLRKGSPAQLDTGLVKISTVLVGYGVGMVATFKNSVQQSVKTIMSQLTESTTTGTRIFGINLGTDSSSSNSNFVSTSDVTFDSDSCTITIPQLNSGVPVLLGLLGQVQQTSNPSPPKSDSGVDESAVDTGRAGDAARDGYEK